MSKYGVFSGPYFPTFSLNKEWVCKPKWILPRHYVSNIFSLFYLIVLALWKHFLVKTPIKASHSLLYNELILWPLTILWKLVRILSCWYERCFLPKFTKNIHVKCNKYFHQLVFTLITYGNLLRRTLHANTWPWSKLTSSPAHHFILWSKCFEQSHKKKRNETSFQSKVYRASFASKIS